MPSRQATVTAWRCEQPKGSGGNLAQSSSRKRTRLALSASRSRIPPKFGIAPFGHKWSSPEQFLQPITHTWAPIATRRGAARVGIELPEIGGAALGVNYRGGTWFRSAAAHQLRSQSLMRQYLLLELEHTDAILPGVDEPGHQPKTYVGDAINGFQPRQVVLLNRYALRAEVTRFCFDVRYAK